MLPQPKDFQEINHKRLGYSFMGVEIEINHDCNRACVYCPNSMTERKSKGHMPESTFLAILNQLRAIHYCGRISYHFYNEPLLSPNLDRYVSLTKEFLPNCRIELYTNGTLLSRERFDALLKFGVDKFTVTKHHGKDEYLFDQVFASLSPIERKKVKFQNFRDLLFTSRGGLLKVGYVKTKPPLPLPCYIPASVIVITVNGDVVPCFEDYHEENSMGNVLVNPLPEIWHSEKYKKFRDDLKANKRSEHPVCRSCNCQLILM